MAIELQADGLGNFLTHSSISVRPIYLDICPQRCDNRFKCYSERNYSMSKCAVSGMIVWLGFEMLRGSCVDSSRMSSGMPIHPFPPHECHALEPHTEIAMENETPHKVLSTAGGSSSTDTALTPSTGSLVITEVSPVVTS